MTQTFVVAGGIVRNRDWILGYSIDAITDQTVQPSALFYLTGDNIDLTENVLIEKRFDHIWNEDITVWYDVYHTGYAGWERSGEIRYSSENMSMLRNMWAKKAIETYPHLTHLWVVDSDVLPERECLKELLNEDCQIAGAHVPLQDGITPIYMAGWDKQEKRPRRMGSVERKADNSFFATLVGGSYLIKREAIDAGVRWGPHPQGEDGYFADSCREHHMLILACPSAKTRHIMDREAWEKEHPYGEKGS
jgi:hypothetical protein